MAMKWAWRLRKQFAGRPRRQKPSPSQLGGSASKWPSCPSTTTKMPRLNSVVTQESLLTNIECEMLKSREGLMAGKHLA